MSVVNRYHIQAAGGVIVSNPINTSFGLATVAHFIKVFRFLTAFKSKTWVGPDHNHSEQQKMGSLFRQQTTIIFSVDFDQFSLFLSCQEVPFVKEMYL